MISINDIYWAAGFMEGEGCFSIARRAGSGLQVSAAQVTLEPLERLISLFGGAIYPQSQGKWYVWYCGGARGAGVAMTLFSLMTKRRKMQIIKSLRGWMELAITNKLKTHCKHGHKYSAENTYTSPQGWRRCRECKRIRYLEKKREVNYGKSVNKPTLRKNASRRFTGGS